MPGKRGSLEERFRSKFIKGKRNECWEWQANTNGVGYGILSRGSSGAGMVYAHRLAYELHYGITLSRGHSRIVMHKCDNPGCVNPQHLVLGTQSDNLLHMYEMGRHPVNRSSRSTNPPHLVGSAHGRARLTEVTVRRIRDEHASGKTIHAIVTETGISKGAIVKALYRHTWRHVP